MTHQLTESRLRALSRLLEYPLAESRELGLSDLERLLDAAALAVSDELHDAKARLPTTEAWRARLPSKS